MRMSQRWNDHDFDLEADITGMGVRAHGLTTVAEAVAAARADDLPPEEWAALADMELTLVDRVLATRPPDGLAFVSAHVRAHYLRMLMPKDFYLPDDLVLRSAVLRNIPMTVQTQQEVAQAIDCVRAEEEIECEADFAANSSLGAEQQERLSAHPSATVRASLAANPFLMVSLRERLADDPQFEVRHTIWARMSPPPRAALVTLCMEFGDPPGLVPTP